MHSRLQGEPKFNALRQILEMIMDKRLKPAELASLSETLPDWTEDDKAGQLHRQFSFKDFSEAFAFMTRVALLAEKAGHHPDWSNSYKTVDIVLSTHDAGGITDKDVALARAIDGLLGRA
jgi:4a-hydroxytetrahydrobiopterin dehydratase